MLRFLSRRLAMLVATLLVASFAIYGALDLAPGSPIAALTGGRTLPPEVMAQIDAAVAGAKAARIAVVVSSKSASETTQPDINLPSCTGRKNQVCSRFAISACGWNSLHKLVRLGLHHGHRTLHESDHHWRGARTAADAHHGGHAEVLRGSWRQAAR